MVWLNKKGEGQHRGRFGGAGPGCRARCARVEQLRADRCPALLGDSAALGYIEGATYSGHHAAYLIYSPGAKERYGQGLFSLLSRICRT